MTILCFSRRGGLILRFLGNVRYEGLLKELDLPRLYLFSVENYVI
jgi:hypothetical protein